MNYDLILIPALGILCVSSTGLLFYMTWILAGRLAVRLQGIPSGIGKAFLLVRTVLIVALTSWILVYPNPLFDIRHSGCQWLHEWRTAWVISLVFLLGLTVFLGIAQNKRKSA